MMAKTPSLFGDSGDTAFPAEELSAARDCIAQAFKDDRADFLVHLRALRAKYPDIASVFAWLHAHERRHADDNDALVMLSALLDGRMFRPSQRKRSADAAAVELEKALKDRDISDDVKIDILPLLDMADHPVDDDAAHMFFRDFEAAMNRRSRKYAGALSDSPDSLYKLLQIKGFIPEEEEAANIPVSVESASELLTLGHRTAEVNPAGVTLMTAALMFRVGAPDFSHERSPSQLNDIHALATPRARWCLETLANWPGFAMPFRDKAARLAVELAGRGVECHPPPAPKEFSHGVVSMVDGMGSRTATLFFHTLNGGIDAFSVMLNDEVGVKDVQAFFGDGGELEDMLRFSSKQMSMANATPGLFRELLADSFALHEELGTAPPGSLFPLMAYLGNDPIVPRKREPDLSVYALGSIRVTLNLVLGGRDLADSMLFGCLLPASDEAYSFCKPYVDKKRKGIVTAIFPSFLRKVMPLERERLLRRMAINLEVEALAGRAKRKNSKAAARLWLGMKNNVANLEIIPYIQTLALHGIEAIVEDLRRGFTNQRDAFAASGKGMPPGEDFGRLMGLDDLDALPPEAREAIFGGMMQHLFGGADSEFPPAELLRATLELREKPREKAKVASVKKRNIYRLSVDVRGWPPMLDDFMQAHPGIIREIEIGGDQTLEKLHLAIFRAFEREDMHAYEFQFAETPMESGAPRYVHPHLMDDDASGGLAHNAATTTLDELALAAGQTFLYWFDFGDDWWHGITVKKIGSPEPRSRYPRTVAKHGFSPPQYHEM